MKPNYLFLANGFEEVEALTVIDLLRRAEMTTHIVAIAESHDVVGAHNITVKADVLLADVAMSEATYLILPGGMPGTNHLNECEPLKQWLVAHAAQGGQIAAICAAPLVLGGLGLLDGEEATCYPSFESTLKGATVVDRGVVVSNNYTTSQGVGTAIDFALSLVAQTKGEAAASELAASICYTN